MNTRAKSPTPGLRPAFASASQPSLLRRLGSKSASADSTASQRNAPRGLGRKAASQSTAPETVESVLTDTLHIIERLIAQSRARIAAYDAIHGPAPLPSLTSAFATRREIFGAFDGEDDNG